MFRPDRLVLLRNEINLPQEAVAERLRMSRGGYSLYEAEHRVPSLDSLEKIADLFHVSTDYLLGRDETTEMVDISVLSLTEQKSIRHKLLNASFMDEENKK